MSSASGSPNSANYLDFDEYVDLKLQKTRSTIKTTDLLVAIAGLAVIVLGYLLAFVVVDQWLVTGGLSVTIRWVLLSCLIVGTLSWLIIRIGIPSLRNVNRLYAAKEIEKSEPSLRSNLLNLVDLRAAGREVNPAIMRALEKKAAVQLQNVDVGQAVDNRPLMRTAYILLAIVVAFCLYALLSPKKISNSIWRALLPTVDVTVSTRTEIESVVPGDRLIVAGELLDVQVDLKGEIPHDVQLYFSTDDGEFRDQTIELRTDEPGQTRFKGRLAVKNGLGPLNDLSYYIKAGDAVSRTYRITVEQPPSATIEKLTFDYPTYMKLEGKEQTTGAIDEWDGTRVTLTARTNMPVKSATIQFHDSAEVDLRGKPEEEAMQVLNEGRQVKATFQLSFRSDGTFPKFYRIHCRTDSASSSPTDIAYPHNIRPDLPPEVALLEPVRDFEAPTNAVIPMLIQARDPDFELSLVNLLIERGGRSILKESLLDKHQAQATLKYDLQLSRLAIVPGDVLELSVEAFDNKSPRPNRRVTPKLKVTIIEPISDKAAQQKLTEDRAKRDQKLADAQREQDAEQPKENEQSPRSNAKERDMESSHKKDVPPKDDNAQTPRDGKQPPQEQRGGAEENTNKPNQDKGSDDSGSKTGSGTSQGTKTKSTGSSEESDPKSTPTESGETKPQETPSGQGTKTTESGKTGSGSQDKRGSQSGAEKNKSDPEQKSLDSDGADDDKALETLIKKLKEQEQNKGQQPTGTPQEQKPQTGRGNDPKTDPSSTQETPSNDKPDNKPSNPNGSDPDPKGTEQPKPQPSSSGGSSKDTEKTTEKDKADKGKTEKDKTENKPSDNLADPMNKGRDSNPPSSDPASSGTEKPEQPPKPNGTGTGKEPDPKNTGKPENTPSPEKTESKPSQGGTKNPSPESTDPMPSADKGTDGKKPMPSPSGDGEKGTTSKPDPKQQTTDETGKPGKSPTPGQGDKDQPNPKEMPDKTGASSKDDPDSSTFKPGEPTAEDKSAVKKPGTGKEKGVAQPNDDPNADATPAEDKDLKRDPNTKPTTRPGDPSKDPKAEQQPTEPGAPSKDGKAEPRKTNPNAADEPLKTNQGKKDQRADQPTGGGEPGTSKPDKSGNDTTPDAGPGADSTKPGDMSKGTSPTGKPDPNKGSGEGSTSKSSDGKGKETPQSGSKSESGSEKGTGPETSEQKSGTDPKPTSKDGKPEEKHNETGEQSGANPNDPKSNQNKADSGKSDKSDQKSNQDQGGKRGEQKGGGGGEPGGKGANSSGAASGNPQDGSKSGGGANTSSSGTGAKDGVSGSGTPEGDAANVEYNKRATELVLKRLQQQLERGDVDPELLEELGWTPDQLKQFSDRLAKHLDEAKSDDNSPEAIARRQQFEETLKGIDLKRDGAKRTGENAPQRDVQQTDSRRSAPPAQYKSAAEKFSKSLNKQKSGGKSK